LLDALDDTDDDLLWRPIPSDLSPERKRWRAGTAVPRPKWVVGHDANGAAHVDDKSEISFEDEHATGPCIMLLDAAASATASASG
jgi:hypothetical protein